MTEVQATTVYLSTTSVTGIGGTDYRNLTTSTGSADASTSVKNAKNTGKFYFDPLTGTSTATGDPDSGTPVGYGWATSYTISGVIPAGDWTFQTNTSSSSASGQGRMGYVVYKNCSGTNTKLFSVFNGTTNVLGATTSTKIITTTSQPSFSVGGCYLKVEYWHNVTSAGSSSTGKVTFGINDANAYITYPTPLPAYINVSLNSPQDNTWNASQSITHTYIPYIVDATFLNCTLFTNHTGTWASRAGNSTTIANASANTITYNYAADHDNFKWNVYCYTTDISNYSTSNFTLKIDTASPSQVTGLTNSSTGATWVNISWNAATDSSSNITFSDSSACFDYGGCDCADGIGCSNPSQCEGGGYSTCGESLGCESRTQATSTGSSCSSVTERVCLCKLSTCEGSCFCVESGSCNYQCNSGYFDCDSNSANGCESAASCASGIGGSGIGKYLIWRNGTNIANTTNTWYNDTGLNEFNLYQFIVGAQDVAGNFGANSTARLVNTTDVTPPTQVTGLTNSSTADSWVNISWSASTDSGSGIQKYLIWRNGTNIANTTNTYYNNTGLTPSTSYGYIVGAVDRYNNFGQNSTALVVNTSAPAPYLIVTLNSPQTSVWNTSQTINHSYTPLILGATFLNCTLFTNHTGTWASRVGNSTPIVNNSVNNITLNYGSDYDFIRWNVYCYDTTGTLSNYSASNFTLRIDTIPPTYYAGSVGTNDSTPTAGQSVKFYSQWNDRALSRYIFSWNASGANCDTWGNDSAATFQTSNWTNTTQTIPATCSGSIGYIFYANDTARNWNDTGINTITVGAATNVSTNQSNYTACGAVFYKISLYDSNSKLTDSYFSLKVIDPGLVTVLTQTTLYPNNGTGIYIGSYLLNSSSQLGAWLLKVTAGSAVTGKNFYVSSS